MAVPPFFWPCNQLHKNKGTCCTAELPYCSFPILTFAEHLSFLFSTNQHITFSFYDQGYFVLLAFYDEFDIKCTSKDNVAVSSGRLQYREQPRGSRTTAVLCGTSRIVNVSVPDRDMWIRFSAGRGEGKQTNIGFKATYLARGNRLC